jgi:phage tail-like protein
MMRAALQGMPVAHPIGDQLPAVYAEDDFAQRMTSALDDVLAPVFATLDCLPDYFDPILAPPDFVEWLAGWVAFSLDEGWTLAQRRALVANAVELHRLRGTARGLDAHVRLLSLGDVEIVETGSCTVSSQPRWTVASPEPHVEVRVTVADPSTIDEARLLAAIVEAAPAHVAVSLTVNVADPARGASGRASARVAVRSAPVSGSAPVPPQAPPPAPEGPGTRQLQQPSSRVSASASVPAQSSSSAPSSSPSSSAAAVGPPDAGDDRGSAAGPPPQPGRGRARGVARPPDVAPLDPGAPPPQPNDQ